MHGGISTNFFIIRKKPLGELNTLSTKLEPNSQFFWEGDGVRDEPNRHLIRSLAPICMRGEDD